MQRFPSAKHQYIPFLTVALVAVVLFGIQFIYSSFASDTLWPTLNLNFDRYAINNGQYWRILSGHFLHTNYVHLILNSVGLCLIWMLHGDYANYKNFTINFCVLGVGISVLILLFSPHIILYVGLSGVLHGMFVWGSLVDIKHKRLSGYALLVGVLIKLIDERYFIFSSPSNTLMSDLIDATVAVDAHLYGAIIGLVLGLVYMYQNRQQKS